MKRLLFVLLAATSLTAAAAPKSYTLTSPDGALQTTVTVGERLTYDLCHEGRTLVEPSALALRRADGITWGPAARVAKATRQSVDEEIASPFYRASSVRDRYNALTLRMRGGWSVEFRAYDDGVAYRFVSHDPKPFCVADEEVEYRFAADFPVTVPYVRYNAGDFEKQYFNSFENAYTVTPLSKWDGARMAFLPLVVDAGEGVKVALSEADLESYPGLYLWNGDASTRLTGRFAPYPKQVEQGGYNQLQGVVVEREAYIARIEAPRALPWRMAVVGSDTELAASNLSYLLAAPSRIADTSWIRPGKVAWEWWNDCNLAGVDFRTGINNETYKYYIDFAAREGIEYVILDEGWSVHLAADLMQVVPEIDLPELVRYGKERGVGIILWAGYWAFDRDLERICRHYAEMGVAGFKVDFMDRDDQLMTAFNYRAAEITARYGLLLDLHGSHKPAGMNRTWPNVLNFEGVNGLETVKWDQEVDLITNEVYIPFLRQLSGPMDYTQGAMLNAVAGAYRASNSEPMSQGTRCRQLALYVVLDSPLNMLCDSPTNYERERESLSFIAAIPTVWDETRILDGRMGEYIVTARRSGKTWYVGGLTDKQARDMEVDLSTLVEGECTIELFRDGVNAHRKGTDYRRETLRRDTARPLRLHLAPGGGFALKIEN